VITRFKFTHEEKLQAELRGKSHGDDKYCVIGNPIAHSRSPGIHAAFALQTGQDIVYERCLAPLDGFADTVRGLIAQGYRGANVTVPFKLEAAAIATRLEERARLAGAVNTLRFEGGEIVGDNTDGPGLVADIVRNAGVPLKANACCCWARAGRRAAWCCRSCSMGRRRS
jgi:shikimate 5-dehydrogenase